MNKPSISRRDLIKYSAYGMATIVVSNGITACGGDDNNNIAMSFDSGVASGDPLSDRVVIWTRALPDDTANVTSLNVQFEVASDANFSNITNRGEASVTADTDFTLKVDVTNLSAATTYFYRFLSNGVTSDTGTTRTLPATDATVEQVRFAVFSCSNYPAGFFNAYTEALNESDLDAVLHLGDYIYEYERGNFGDEDLNSDNIGRALPENNNTELFTLQDYRLRYALYRTDAGLRSLHQQAPFIVVPDDHEVANDTFINGAENHNEGEGDFSARKAAALQAYFEWLPIRPFVPGDNATFNRAFQWGNLVNLLMLDTRHTARSEKIPEVADPFWLDDNNNFRAEAFQAALVDPSRTMLGQEQLGWMLDNMATSTATWQVLGQQVLMGRMFIPTEVLLGLGDLAAVNQSITELATIRGRIAAGDPTVTDAERARVETALPYNLDAWDGYFAEREFIFGNLEQMAKNVVVLAGDTHNAWASNLRTLSNNPVGVEFATPGVTSPGLEQFLSLDVAAARGLEQGLSLIIDPLQYTNLNERGLMFVTFTAESATAEWRFIDTIDSTDYNVVPELTTTMSVAAGSNTLTQS